MRLIKYSVNELMCIGEHALQKDAFVYASTPFCALEQIDGETRIQLPISRKFFDSDFKYLGTEVVSDDLLTEVK